VNNRSSSVDERFEARWDGGSCSAAIERFAEGCRIGRVGYETRTPTGVTFDNTMGTAFVECGKKTIVCDRTFVCRCTHPKRQSTTK
jgi:hypothetical protein